LPTYSFLICWGILVMWSANAFSDVVGSTFWLILVVEALGPIEGSELAGIACTHVSLEYIEEPKLGVHGAYKTWLQWWYNQRSHLPLALAVSQSVNSNNCQILFIYLLRWTYLKALYLIINLIWMICTGDKINVVISSVQ